jgi:hypothetical protein
VHPIATIVLPVHNMERTLRPEVTRILDLAEILGRRVLVAIIDDGSQDGTYELACELAREFPQVRAMRQPHQRGLGGALEQVRVRLRVDRVVAHDGVAAIDLDELACALAASAAHVSSAPAATREPATEACGSRRFVAPKPSSVVNKATLSTAGSFHWLRLDEPLTSRRSRHLNQSTPAPGSGNMSALLDRATTFTPPTSFTN